MTAPDDIVMRDGPLAAEFLTGLSGWVSRHGEYYGNGSQAESMARYAGCTHVACAKCGAPTPKNWTACDACRAAMDLARYLAKPEEVWDGEAMLYSETRDSYYIDLDAVEDALEEGQTLSDLRLVICEPNYIRPLDSEYCCDELPDDGDLPSEVEAAMDAFNKAVEGVVLSWSPGDTRFKLDTLP